jgi:endonuclease/exonuclease/phosphatase family metal-dependent hydrolase
VTISRSRRTPHQILAARIAAARVPAARPDNLRVATWNIRELGKTRRLPESLAIIARILRCFDLVSIVELRDDLTDFQGILRLLGPTWSAVFSDYRSDHHGNRERIAFVFRSDRVTFTGLASNAEIERKPLGLDSTLFIPWWRPPFLASFQAGNFPFLLVAAHVRWGKTVAGRENEIKAVGAWLTARRTERAFGGENVLVVGDFNIASKRSRVWAALHDSGLVEAPGLDADPGSDLVRGKRYDRILCTADDAERLSEKGGTVDFTGGEGMAGLEAILPGTGKTPGRLTWQVSDHLPVWGVLGVG